MSRSEIDLSWYSVWEWSSWVVVLTCCCVESWNRWIHIGISIVTLFLHVVAHLLNASCLVSIVTVAGGPTSLDNTLIPSHVGVLVAIMSLSLSLHSGTVVLDSESLSATVQLTINTIDWIYGRGRLKKRRRISILKTNSKSRWFCGYMLFVSLDGMVSNMLLHLH